MKYDSIGTYSQFDIRGTFNDGSGVVALLDNRRKYRNMYATLYNRA